MTAPEPTAEQLREAMDALGWHKSWPPSELSATELGDVTRVARALAAAVHAEREKMRAALDETRPDPSWDELYIEGYLDGTRDSARRIREVAG